MPSIILLVGFKTKTVNMLLNSILQLGLGLGFPWVF